MSDQKSFDYESERKEVISVIHSEGQIFRTLLRQLEAQKEEGPEFECSILNSKINKHYGKILIAAEHLESQGKLKIIQKECERMRKVYPEGVENEFFQGFESHLEKTMQEAAVRFRQRVKKAERLGELP